MPQTIYENFVIENKYNSVLDTKLDLQQFMKVDRELAENAGMIKKIVSRTPSGDVEDLEMGVGNTEIIEVATATKDYEVGVTQGRFNYYDEEAMADPMVVDAGLNGLAEKMVNDFVDKAVEEWEDATLIKYECEWTFDDVVDAIALMNVEQEDGLFMLISPAIKSAVRKNLADDLKYSEGFARTGYIGSVCGVPVYVSKAIPAGEAILATKEAVTLFLKKSSEIEQERDANTRKNSVFARRVALVALTDASKVVLMTEDEEPEPPTP